MDDKKKTGDKNFFRCGSNLSQGEGECIPRKLNSPKLKFYPSGDFSNDDDDDDDDGWRERQKNVNFARASRFLYICLPLLHDYEVEMPNFEFLLRM